MYGGSVSCGRTCGGSRKCNRSKTCRGAVQWERVGRPGRKAVFFMITLKTIRLTPNNLSCIIPSLSVINKSRHFFGIFFSGAA